MKLKRFKNFINENDNLKRSEAGLDRFGMSNYDDLPDEIKKEAIKQDYENVNLGGYDGISDKSIFSKNILIDFEDDDFEDGSIISVYVSADSDNRFTAESYIIFSIDIQGNVIYDDMILELFRKRYEYEDIIKMIKNSKEIEKKLVEYLSNREFKELTNEEKEDLILDKLVKSLGVDPKKGDRVIVFN